MYWGLTIKGLFREFVVAKHAAERTRRQWISQAWLTAALTRTKTMPELHTLLVSRVGRQTRDEQRQMVQTISARFGIPLQKTRLIRVEVNG